MTDRYTYDTISRNGKWRLRFEADYLGNKTHQANDALKALVKAILTIPKRAMRKQVVDDAG